MKSIAWKKPFRIFTGKTTDMYKPQNYMVFFAVEKPCMKTDI